MLLLKFTLFKSLSEKNSLVFINEFLMFLLLFELLLKFVSFPIISFFSLFFMSFNSRMFLFVKPFILRMSIVSFVDFIEF